MELGRFPLCIYILPKRYSLIDDASEGDFNKCISTVTSLHDADMKPKNMLVESLLMLGEFGLLMIRDPQLKQHDWSK